MSIKRFLFCIIALFAVGLQSAHAVLQITAESDIAAPGGAVHDPFQPVFTGGSVSSSDVLEGLLPSSTIGNFTLESSAGVAALTNGSDSTVYPQGGLGGDVIDHAAYATIGLNDGGTELTYSLGGAYDVQEIVVYGGWNDGGRDAQKYDIHTSGDGVNFSLLGSHDGGDGEMGGEPIGWRVEFSDSLGADIADDITHLRLTFPAVENNFTGISEIDLIGTLVNVPGDANGDGLVNTADFIVISNNFFSTPTVLGTNGDIDFSGFVDGADFRMWKDLPHDPDPPLATNVEAVPEPTALLLAGVGALLFNGRQCRRR
ncbi:MAG: PEP-CTERM sorting domain-containing protein [Pirellulales bacterium]|nr:PEP-CTERM sorting domain-containing protein [Pirellulales bacterium]